MEVRRGPAAFTCALMTFGVCAGIASAQSQQQGQRADTQASPQARAEQAIKRFEIERDRERALWDVVAIGKPAVTALDRATRDPRPDVVIAAVRALGFLGTDAKAALPRLLRLTNNKNRALRRAAASASDAIAGGRGHYLCVDFDEGWLIEIDGEGKQRKVLKEFGTLRDGQLLANGSYLIVDSEGVHEVDAAKHTRWSFAAKGSCQATRLPGGITLVADTRKARVVEVDMDQKVVWSFRADEEFWPTSAQRLANGNTLICDYRQTADGGLIEVDRDGKVVWNLPWKQAAEAARLPDGRTIITSHKPGVVSVVDARGKVVRSIKPDEVPSHAMMLPNRHIVVSCEGVLREYDENDRELWSVNVPWAVRAQRH